ncbi:four-carbon acid sugar kinase family protein [Microbacterium sp. NPDC058021]|uniref:four-carbon acid sugar kinase family protein n=1 Tax=Microbacterium sp. NPDC058021 TaxID=3346306 RepID=UPI0036DAF4EA
MSSGVRAAFYGDDFTGSVDALLQFERRGWTGRLFVGVPPTEALGAAAAEADVIGIAGIARSLAVSDLDAELEPALRALVSVKPHLVQYKACSTADSSPSIGNLGRVIELGRALVCEDRPVPMLFAQPDFGRYTVFGHHFAAEDGVVYRLDQQPTMSTHPSTPMTESDLAVHLSHQTDLPITSMPYTAYTSPEAIAAGLSTTEAAAVVLDTLDDRHLDLLGAAVGLLPTPVFAVGSGGLSHAVAAATPGMGRSIPTTTPTDGPVLAVSGSRSAQTRRQVDAARAAGWWVRPLAFGADAASFDDVLSALAAGRSVVLTSDDADASGVRPDEILAVIAEAAASVVAAAAHAAVVRRVVVCGGDTSSRVTRLLGVDSLSIVANPWANVVLLRAHADDPAIDGLELLLKGGQVGDADLLERVRAL